MRVVSLYRYPVKGLSPERLDSVRLERGAYFPGDRLYAIENGPSGFDPADPRHQPKIKFLMLMRNETLARLRTRYDEATQTLSVDGEGSSVTADLSQPQGRLALEAFIRRVLPRELRGPPKVLTAPDGFRFTDSRRGYVSVINLASVQAVADMMGRPVDPLRFRGNVMVEGLEPWAELDLVGAELGSASGLRLKVTKRIERCAATNVDPATGERDMEIPKTLMRRLGHVDCGIYAEIVAGGELRPGELLEIRPEAQASLLLAGGTMPF
ncbi:MOSC domain-containing protein [Enterovirga aerilata]|uniref:MOSC domain-containing protein n=1 Tax=Enterovirga aerilata TaxID=2730920 RepID=A0A849ID90_9HYPH|nr:MOSC domain-containing protein [Enterovirga sp. DB1703]NNM74010.1 MOSC domain-containing protein [Enterovirga sp. DB1703]